MAGTGGNMMAQARMDSVADSGYGVTVGGFHCPAIEFNGRLAELSRQMGYPFDLIAAHEENGYIDFVAVCQTVNSLPLKPAKLEIFRREPHKFFADLQKFIGATRAQRIHQIQLIGSLGAIALILLVHPVESGA